MGFFDGLLRPRKGELAARAKSSAELAQDQSIPVTVHPSPPLQRKKKRQRRPEAPGNAEDVYGLGISTESPAEGEESPLRSRNRERDPLEPQSREETRRRPQNRDPTRPRRPNHNSRHHSVTGAASGGRMRGDTASGGFSETSTSPVGGARTEPRRPEHHSRSMPRPNRPSVAATASTEDIFVDAIEAPPDAISSSEHSPETSPAPSSGPVTPRSSPSGIEGGAAVWGASPRPIVDPALSPTQAYGLLIRPPPLDEYSEFIDESPPYRETLHKNVDVVLFDLRFGPILRVNRFLIRDDLVLKSIIESFEKCQVIPRNIDLLSICHIDDDEYDAMIPTLLGYATGDIPVSGGTSRRSRGSSPRDPPREERSERRGETRSRTEIGDDGRGESPTERQSTRNTTERQSTRNTTERQSTRNTTEREQRREARTQRAARSEPHTTRENSSISHEARNSRREAPAIRDPRRGSPTENGGQVESRAEREAQREARLERQAQREARRYRSGDRMNSGSNASRNRPSSSTTARRSDADRDRRPRTSGTDSTASRGSSRPSRVSSRPVSRPTRTASLTANSRASQRRTRAGSGSHGVPNFPAEALAAYASARTAIQPASINDDYLYALYLALVEQGVSFHEPTRQQGIPVNDYLTPPAYRSVLNV